jgi:DNA polymerase (family X)
VGDAIAKRIMSLYHGEPNDTLDRMRGKLPSGLLELLAIPGLKPPTILKLHTLLGVNSVEDLAGCRWLRHLAAGRRRLSAARK